MSVEPVKWREGRLYIIDQTLLPGEYVEIPLDTVEAVWEAVKKLRVRGAPAIGIAAAFGVVVATKNSPSTGIDSARDVCNRAADYLATSRPTAVNLFWALERMKRVASGHNGDMHSFVERLEREAVDICEEDKRRCREIGEYGSDLIHDGDGVLTHCNAGALATGAYGTALGVMVRAQEKGRRFRVFADETRPLLQGARLTAWELAQAGIDITLICDNMAAQVMREGKVNLVVVGADRIAANGDTANKIGTYGVALLAKAHDIPFYVAAPLSTFDVSLESGARIPIEQRQADEITHWHGQRMAPEGISVYNPAFDVTPAALVAGIITEKGILRPPYKEAICDCFHRIDAILTR